MSATEIENGHCSNTVGVPLNRRHTKVLCTGSYYVASPTGFFFPDPFPNQKRMKQAPKAMSTGSENSLFDKGLYFWEN